MQTPVRASQLPAQSEHHHQWWSDQWHGWNYWSHGWNYREHGESWWDRESGQSRPVGSAYPTHVHDTRHARAMHDLRHVVPDRPFPKGGNRAALPAVRTYTPEIKQQRAEVRRREAIMRQRQNAQCAAPELKARPGEPRICQWEGCPHDWYQECACCGRVLCDNESHWVPSPNGHCLHCNHPECCKRADDLRGTWISEAGEWVSEVTYYHLSELLMSGQPGYRAPGTMPGEVEPSRRTKRNRFRGWHAGRVPKDEERDVDPDQY